MQNRLGDCQSAKSLPNDDGNLLMAPGKRSGKDKFDVGYKSSGNAKMSAAGRFRRFSPAGSLPLHSAA